MKYTVIREMTAYVEQLLSTIERIQLSTESIINIILPSFLNRGEEGLFSRFSATLKETIWRTYVKGIASGTFMSAWGLIGYFNYSLKSKIRLDKRYLLHSTFGKR